MDINYDGDLSKTRTCFRKNTYVFLENYVRVFGKSRTCFSENTYMFFRKVVHVFGYSRTCFSGNDIDSLNPSNLARMFDNHLF